MTWDLERTVSGGMQVGSKGSKNKWRDGREIFFIHTNRSSIKASISEAKKGPLNTAP